VNRQHLPVEFPRRGGFLVEPVEIANVLAGFTDDARVVVISGTCRTVVSSVSVCPTSTATS
jgi:hypothetical protein